ncbi:hypothetical protein HJG44_12795 [Enterovirga sp. DB1703]|uniref:Uncharacterized protein n=1 Tax=Enterovirga aerilata TaxID=2730920 RepID=A0A849IA34_9HYPH|nr:hypothetical protein [Enterovirga sp. DB1703]
MLDDQAVLVLRVLHDSMDPFDLVEGNPNFGG